MSNGPDSCYNLTARRSARSLTRLYDRHLAPAGLSSSQFSILAVIGRSGATSIADLAHDMVMERTTLMRAMTRLESDGLIERRQSDQHRGLSLSLSEAGRQKLKSAAPYWHGAQQAYETRVGKDRAAGLRDAILDIGFDA